MMKRKILSVVLSICTLMTSISVVVPAVAAASAENVIFSDDFSGGDLSAKGWKIASSTANTITNVGGVHGNVMQYKGAWDGFGVDFDTAVTGGKLDISFDINLKKFGDTDTSNAKALGMSLLKKTLQVQSSRIRVTAMAFGPYSEFHD